MHFHVFQKYGFHKDKLIIKAKALQNYALRRFIANIFAVTFDLGEFLALAAVDLRRSHLSLAALGG